MNHENKIEWQEVELSEICKIVSGSTPNTSKEEYWKNGDICWITPAEINDGNNGYYYETKKKITKKGLESASINIFPRGTVMLTSRAPIGKVAIAGKDMCSNQGFKNFICDTDKLNPEYLYFWLRLKKGYLNSIGHGATFKEISKSMVSKIKIILPFLNGKPNLKEQERIVRILEKAEKMKEGGKKTIDLLDEYLKVIFFEMFYNKRFEEIELGNERICLVSGEYGSGASAKSFDGKIRYIRITDIDENGSLRSEKVSPSKIEERYFLKKGDLLFARSGATVGKTYLHNKEDNFQYAGYLIRFRFNNKIVPGYVYFFTKTPKYLNWISLVQKVVAQPNINAKQYSSLKIPLPPISLQEKFDSIVEQVEKMKENIKETNQNSEELFNSLMSKAFRGELS